MPAPTGLREARGIDDANLVFKVDGASEYFVVVEDEL